MDCRKEETVDWITQTRVMHGYLITHRDTANPCLAPPPTCFMSLPTDIKLKIFESLGGVDLAKIGCVCSELRCLSSDPYLWKRKFVETFWSSNQGGNEIHWKGRYAARWKKQQCLNEVVFRLLEYQTSSCPLPRPRRRGYPRCMLPGLR